MHQRCAFPYALLGKARNVPKTMRDAIVAGSDLV
jgi:hypothetical protein